MGPKIDSALLWFRRIYLDGIPILLRQNDTAFLSFICVVTAIDALAGYRYPKGTDEGRFCQFVIEHFPSTYTGHAPNLYKFRCRMVHNFSPAYFSLIHANPQAHLQPSPIGDITLNDSSFFSDMRTAAENYFSALSSNPDFQNDMLSRLNNLDRGGAIAVAS